MTMMATMASIQKLPDDGRKECQGHEHAGRRRQEQDTNQVQQLPLSLFNQGQRRDSFAIIVIW